jgi:hypothetical protein
MQQHKSNSYDLQLVAFYCETSERTKKKLSNVIKNINAIYRQKTKLRAMAGRGSNHYGQSVAARHGQ